MSRKQSLLLSSLFVCLALPVFGQQFLFDLSGNQEVPPVASPFSGGCYGLLDQPGATFAVTCVHNVENATVMHIHRAPAGANGAIAFDMGDPSSGFVSATWTSMTPADISELLAGDLYINIHTAGRPTGEIRGQILPQTVDMVAFTANGAQVVPPGASPSTANCTADLNAGLTALDIQCTHTMAAPTAAHVHEAPVGETGPVIFTFASPASPLSGSVPMTPVLLADYAARFLYLDLHAGDSEENSDEIRGQIGIPPPPITTGTIVIEKLSYPSGGLAFPFTESITSGAFALDDGQTQTFNNVAAGSYTVTEGASGDFALADISCDDADSSTDLASRTATIALAAGETVRCTFRNFESEPTDELFIFHMSPDQEVPPLTGPERGGCMGRFDATTNELSLICTHNVDLPTAIHAHRAPIGANGPIVFDMGLPTSPVMATWSMTPGDVADLMAGNLYINIHTAGRPAGATRGQILPRTVDMVNFTLDAAQVVPPGTSPATGNCTADLDGPATQLAIACTHTLASPSAANVHQGDRDENGPVAFTFASPASPINQNVPMSPRLVADYAAQLLYLDIHGTGSEEEADQIRGQIAPPVVAATTGTIHILKSTSPEGGIGFNFTNNIPGGPAAFTLNDGETRTFTNVPIGSYNVSEVVPAGWSLTDVVCGDDDSVANAFAGAAAINLQGGETVTCTFRNLRRVVAPTTTFVFHMSADQEVPPNGSTARGGCFGQLDQAARTFSLVCTHNVVSPTIAHIHEAVPGENGPIVFDLDDPTSPIEATWTDMTQAQIDSLLAGNYYVNIHASGRPGGEIRGQVLMRTVDNFSFVANAAQEVPPTDSTRTGNCTADLADDDASVFVQCSHNVPVVTDLHVHAAPPGEDGPPIFHFAQTNPFSGDVPLTPRLAADFAAGFLYVNIHSPDYDTGEIRGNMLGAEESHAGAEHVPTASEWALILLAMALIAVALRRM